MIKFVFENDHFNISFGENYKGDWEQACLLTQIAPMNHYFLTQIASNPRQITSAELFFVFHAPKIFQ